MLFACAIFILFIGFCTIPGAGHLPDHSVPTPGNLPISFKKMLMPGGGVAPKEGGGAPEELTDALFLAKIKF